MKEYLQTTPAARQTDEKIGELLRELSGFALEKAEVLMICNERPTGVAELDCVVEEMESRFKEEEVAGMIEVIKRVLG